MGSEQYTFEVDEHHEEHVVIVQISGHVHEQDLAQFERHFQKALKNEKVVIDLRGLHYICSWGFGIMVEGAQTARDENRSVIFVRPETRLVNLFRILQLDLLLQFADSPEDARRAMCEGEGA